MNFDSRYLIFDVPGGKIDTSILVISEISAKIEIHKFPDMILLKKD
jgi:hypothetical protein